MSRFEAQPGIPTDSLKLYFDAGDPDSFYREQLTYVEVLVVAGGGGGGGSTAGGGGAGGVIYNSAFPVPNGAGVTVAVTVGAGGAGSRKNDDGSPNNTNGANSIFSSLTAIGGGYGFSGRPAGSRVANSGGSGGGAGFYGGNDLQVTAPGDGTAGQGFPGGTVVNYGSSWWGGAGGGGASEQGAPNVQNNSLRKGGDGLPFSISGTTTYYGGGGGGGGFGNNTTATPGGQGGGGDGGDGLYFIATSGTSNTGGGGGGSGYYQNGPNPSGGNGGSGIVIVRYPGLPAATGGTITYQNGYTVHVFTSSGQFILNKWKDLSGNGEEATLSNNVYVKNKGVMLFKTGLAKKINGSNSLVNFANTPAANATIVVLSNIKGPDGDWKTLVRGAGGDHQVIIQSFNGIDLGMYDNDGGGFIDSGFDMNTIPNYTTDYHVYFWKLSQSSPYYQFYYDDNTSSPASTITNASATFNNGFASIGGYHNGNAVPTSISQEWGDMKVFLYYDKHLSQTEMDQIYNVLKLRR